MRALVPGGPGDFTVHRQVDKKFTTKLVNKKPEAHKQDSDFTRVYTGGCELMRGWGGAEKVRAVQSSSKLGAIRPPVRP